MGAELTERNGEVNGEVNKQPDRGTGTGNNGNSSSTTSAGSNGGRGTGRGTGTGTADGNKTTEKEFPQVVTVDTGKSEEERKKEERNAKRRERYAKQKAENGQSVKPRKVNGKKKQSDESPINTEQINALILSLSAIVASRPNCEQWLLAESEVDAITKPLVAMIAESEKLEIITQNSNQIALAVACISVFAPRIMVTVQKMKAEREKEKNVRKVEQAKADTERLNKQRSGGNATDDKKPSDVVPFYGVPIS